MRVGGTQCSGLESWGHQLRNTEAERKASAVLRLHHSLDSHFLLSWSFLFFEDG